MIWQEIAVIASCYVRISCYLVAWPSGLRRWFKASVSSGAWVPIPPLPLLLARKFGYESKFLERTIFFLIEEGTLV